MYFKTHLKKVVPFCSDSEISFGVFINVLFAILSFNNCFFRLYLKMQPSKIRLLEKLAKFKIFTSKNTSKLKNLKIVKKTLTLSPAKM